MSQLKELSVRPPKKEALLTVINQLGQRVVFFSLPSETSCIVAMLEGRFFSTGFYDLGDFYHDSDYLPVIFDDKAFCFYDYFYMTQDTK